MKPAIRRAKGKSYEKKISELLHKFIYENVVEYRELFDDIGNDNLKPKRDTSSGNFVNSDNDIDLGLAKKYFPFSIECKHHASVGKMTITTIFKNDISFIRKTMKQAKTHAEKCKLIPLIIMRGNYTSDIVIIENTSELLNKVTRCSTIILVDDLIIVELNEFLKNYFSKYS